MEELTDLFDMIVKSGGSEPGLVNGEAALKRAPWFKGLNPCAEILLGNKSFCNLVEVDVSKYYQDTSGLHKALTLAARMNYRQTIVDFRDGVLQEAWHLNNQFLRLCGVGVTGIVQREDLSEFDWKSFRYSAVTAARTMAKELNTEQRGFAPFGILEYWNIGMMGLNEFYRFYKKIFPAFIPNIPLFHHSTI